MAEEQAKPTVEEILNTPIEAETREGFDEKVREYALQFTTPNKAAHAVGRIKRAVQTGAEISFEPALALERELQQQLFQGIFLIF